MTWDCGYRWKEYRPDGTLLVEHRCTMNRRHEVDHFCSCLARKPRVRPPKARRRVADGLEVGR